MQVVYDFSGPQPNNCEIGEADSVDASSPGRPIAAVAIPEPPAAPLIEHDTDLYPPIRYGVRGIKR